jgi:hypothetical protein
MKFKKGQLITLTHDGRSRARTWNAESAQEKVRQLCPGEPLLVLEHFNEDKISALKAFTPEVETGFRVLFRESQLDLFFALGDLKLKHMAIPLEEFPKYEKAFYSTGRK